MNWQSIETAPFDQELQLSVIEDGEVHALIFPCRRTADGWLRGLTNQTVLIRPTHWRVWVANEQASKPVSEAAC